MSKPNPYEGIPRRVRIGAQTYDVVVRDPNNDGMLSDGTHAYTLEEKNIVVMSSKLHPTKAVTILVHELLHAMFFVYGSVTKPSSRAESIEWEHHFINAWDHGLVSLLRDNPDLLSYLLTEPRPEERH